MLIYSLLSRVRDADSEFKFDCHAFMSFANDWFLALLCRMFAKNTIFCAMAQFSNISPCFVITSTAMQGLPNKQPKHN